jgi:CubicO group peptidase (beta-lactamase class C family)
MPTNPSATFSVPEGWSRQATDTLVELRPPEADLRLVIVETGPASDARSASAAAWKAYRGKETHELKFLTSLPAREGWDERAFIGYKTSPAEPLSVFAHAYRKGQAWTIAILDGSTSTEEKREAQLNAILQSLRPSGYARESFSGRPAHRLDPARVDALLDFVRESAAKLDVPGIGVALIDHGEVVFEGGVGVRNMGHPEPVDAHTKFMVASNTKGMTTLLLARLVDQGRLNWDDPVAKVYPPFRLGDEETTRQVLIRHLVSASTGLPRIDFEFLFNTTAETPPEATFASLAVAQPTSRFGEVYQYNNQVAAAAGFIAGHVAHPDRELGQAYDAAMQELIFDPLGMNETTFSTTGALAGNHASPHAKAPDGELHVLRMDINNTLAPYRPSGGAWSTPHDMILYVQNELAEGLLPDGRRLLAPENLLARRVRGVPMGEDQWYGMGLREDATWGVSVIHHGGGLPGYRSDFFAIPSAQVGAVILTNADNGVFLHRSFRRRLLEILYDGRPQAAEDVSAVARRIEALRVFERKRLIIPAADADISGLATAYANADLGALAIERVGNAVHFRTQAWTSEVASRRDGDGAISFVTIDPQICGEFEFLVGDANDGRRTLLVRDTGQHVYEFVALD